MSEFSIANVMKQNYQMITDEGGYEGIDINENKRIDDNEMLYLEGEAKCAEREDSFIDGPDCYELSFWDFFNSNVPYIKKEIVDKVNLELKKYLSDERIGYRYMATEVLGYTKDKFVVPELTTVLLKEENEAIRLEMIRTLGEIGDVRAVESIIGFLGSKNPKVRSAAAETIGKIGCNSSVTVEVGGEKADIIPAQALGKLLKDKSPEVQINAAAALFKLGDQSGITVLVKLLKNKKNKKNALKVLEEIVDMVSKNLFANMDLIEKIYPAVSKESLGHDVIYSRVCSLCETGVLFVSEIKNSLLRKAVSGCAGEAEKQGYYEEYTEE